MGFVPVKSAEQLEIQAVHRIRQRLVSNRNRLVNQIRWPLVEQGLVVARDLARVRNALSQIAEGVDHVLGELLVELVRDVRDEHNELDQRIAANTKRRF